MKSREILLKLSEARVQSKYIKPSSTLKCRISTNRIFWQSKEAISTPNPVWNNSKNFPISVNTFTIDLVQTDSKSSEALLGSVQLSIQDLLKHRKNWWDLKSNNSPIALVSIEVLLSNSPATSPSRTLSEIPSFYISESPQIYSRDFSKSEKILIYLDKIKIESSKLSSEKYVLDKFAKSLQTKEKCLSEEKLAIQRISSENDLEKKKNQDLILRLSLEYSELKRRNFKGKAEKVLLDNRMKKLRKADKRLKFHKWIIGKAGDEGFKRSILHPVISLSEYVKPVSHDSETPPESPVFTQDSTDPTVTL